jgi:anti-anti-sigma factor
MSEIEKRDNETIVKPSGDIVASMVREFRKELLSLVQEGARELVIDMADVEMIDSLGIGLLIASHNSLTEVGGKLTVTNASNEVYSLLRTMRLDQHFDVKPMN